MTIPSGVENPGNCCVLNVVLQNIASEEAIFSPMLNSQDASDAVEDLRTKIKSCVESIQLGQTVAKDRVVALRKAMIEAGWQDDFSGIIGIICWIFYTCFGWLILRPMDAYTVYSFFRNTLASDLSWNSIGPENSPLAYLEHEPISNSSILHQLSPDLPNNLEQKVHLTFLNRKAIPPGPLNLQGLTQVHACIEIPFANHVWIYRKVAEQWYCINDHVVTRVETKDIEALRTSNIDRLIYRSPTP